MPPKVSPRPGGLCRPKIVLAIAAVVLIGVAEAAPYNDDYDSKPLEEHYDDYSKEPSSSYEHKASYGGQDYDSGHDEPDYGYEEYKPAESKQRYVPKVQV